MNWTKGYLKYSSIIACNLVIFFALLEWSLQFVFVGALPSYFIPRHYPYEHVRAVAEEIDASWVSNDQGFHDKKRRFEKGSDVFRIVAIGDSFLDGPQQFNLTQKLEALLNEKYEKKIEVINLSRPGIDPDMYGLLLKHALKQYSPDLVVNFFYIGNDFRRAEQIDFSHLLNRDESISLYRKYPDSSIISNFFPKVSILIDALIRGTINNGAFPMRRSNFPENQRWKFYPARNLIEISENISTYIEAEPEEVDSFLRDRLSADELMHLTTYGVRLDLLAYMVGVGMNARFREKLNIKNGGRPEIKSTSIERKQVENVSLFINESAKLASRYKAKYTAVMIPTSLVDSYASMIYGKLDASNDPLFSGVRARQEKLLRSNLEGSDVKKIFLRDILENSSKTYLVYDTHWSNKGVEVVADHLSTTILN